MEVFEQTLAAGERWENPGGIYFHLIECPYAVSVQFFSAGGIIAEHANNVSFGYRSIRENDTRFSKVDIVNGATAQTIKIALSEIPGDYNFMAGKVTVSGTVTSSEENKTLAGNCYMGQLNVIGGSNYVYSQLWNPVGSGVNVIIDKYVFGSFTSTVHVWMVDTAARTTDAGVYRNKKGLAVSAGHKLELRTEGKTTGDPYDLFIQAAVTNTVIDIQSEVFGYPYQFVYKTLDRAPLVLTPGTGFSSRNNASGTMAAAATLVEWHEEPI
jgi:hypothetical protein